MIGLIQRLDNSATVIKIRVLSELFIEKATERLYNLCHYPHDMTSQRIAGLSVGMSEETASRVVASLDDVKNCEERKIHSRLHEENKRVRAIYVDFKDDRFLGVTFSETNCGNLVSEVSLVYQNESFPPDLLEKTMREFGRPDFKKAKVGVTQVAWGGRATDQGGTVPYKGVSTTLSAEQVNRRQLSLRLVGHTVLAEEI
jgi:hypothetical protein